MPATDWGWLIAPDELRGWILEETPELLILNKPPHAVCHPSRHGPWSSLIGACREYLGADVLHMPYRLDRETSGVLVFARTKEAGTRLQRAVQFHKFRKTYHAVLTGYLETAITVNAAIGPDAGAEFYSRRKVVEEGGEMAETELIPISRGGGYTIARIHPHSGRRHQIRVHAAHLGHPLAGDKLYGPDPSLMLRFMREGMSPELLDRLKVDRQALHCTQVEFETERGTEIFSAPPAEDLVAFVQTHMGTAWSL